MPKSHGKRRSTGAGKRSGRVPPPREAPDALDEFDAFDDSVRRNPDGPYESRAPYGTGETPYIPPRKKRLLRRVLTSNVTIMIVSIGAIGAAVVLVDINKFIEDDTKPPKMAAADLSTNDMLSRLTSASDMDPIAADAVAAAKKRAYEAHQRELKRLKEKAKRDAKARAELKAKQERERLAKSNPSAGANKAYGKKMSALKGWSRCWPSLLTLWNHESGWNERAENPSSGAYGIPQSLPGTKMESAGSDWRTSSPTQIAWGLGYIKARYDDPCGAWAFWQSHNWY